jgi:uncharacterized protein DUF3237
MRRARRTCYPIGMRILTLVALLATLAGCAGAAPPARTPAAEAATAAAASTAPSAPGASSIELVPLGTMTITIAENIRLNGTPSGDRMIVEFSDIQWRGERINASLKGKAAADWLVIGADGTGLIDIRFTLQTTDGALVYVQMNGRADAAKFAEGAPFFMAPRFETGDPRYAWLNRVQAITKGSAAGGKVTNFVFEAR